MPYRSSNWTGRTPRNMNEAFGPDAVLWTETPRRGLWLMGLFLLALSVAVPWGIYQWVRK